MKIRESELGGAAPKVCSQTRRKLAKSKPSRTTFRPTPVSCGITERSLFCPVKSSLIRDFRVLALFTVAVFPVCGTLSENRTGRCPNGQDRNDPCPC